MACKSLLIAAVHAGLFDHVSLSGLSPRRDPPAPPEADEAQAENMAELAGQGTPYATKQFY